MSLAQAVLTKKLQIFLQTEVSSEFAESIALPYIDFAKAKTGAAGAKPKKAKNCTKGRSCGYGCIDAKKDCKSPLDGQPKTYADWMATQIGNAKGNTGDPKTAAQQKTAPAPKAAKTAKPKATAPATATKADTTTTQPKPQPQAQKTAKPATKPDTTTPTKPAPQPAPQPTAAQKPKEQTQPASSKAISADSKAAIRGEGDIDPFPPGQNFKKARSFNPNAIEDMTPDDFNEFLFAKERLSFQNDKEATHNKTFDQFKSENPSLNTKAAYKSQILQAISNGRDVSDDVLASGGIKLSKGDQARLKANREAVRQDQELNDRIQKAIDYPLMSDSDAKGFRPNMSPEDAMKYAEDSFFSGLSFYHGNPNSVVDSIQNDGADPEKNNRGIYGKGVYFASNFEEAKGYAATGNAGGARANNEEAAVIASAIKMKNPLVIGSAEYSALLENFPGDQSTGIDSVAATNYLRAKGHDGVYLKDNGYIVALDTRQVVTHSRTNYKRNEVEDWYNQQDVKDHTWDNVVKRTSNSPTGKALLDAKENLKLRG